MTHLHVRAAHVALALSLALAAVACGGATDQEEIDGEAPVEGASEEALSARTIRNATVLYQGDWKFLTSCDKWSKGRVRFACDESPSRTFVDEGAWVAMPSSLYSRRSCGQQIELCRGERCITAKVVERSVTSNKWEGSNAVMTALGIDHGAPSCTRSWGTATGVTINVR